jgi:hypothetical protein
MRAAARRLRRIGAKIGEFAGHVETEVETEPLAACIPTRRPPERSPLGPARLSRRRPSGSRRANWHRRTIDV